MAINGDLLREAEPYEFHYKWISALKLRELLAQADPHDDLKVIVSGTTGNLVLLHGEANEWVEPYGAIDFGPETLERFPKREE